MHRVNSLCVLMCALLACEIGAAPVPDDQRLPVDLRRTTLVVRDMRAALAFYRDALGMKVVYDRMLRTPRSARTDDDAERSLQLVFLQANDDFIGMLGLIEYHKPRKTPPASPADPFSIGTMVLVFNINNLDEVFERARNTAGVKIPGEPEQTSYPAYDGEGTIPVRASLLQDPDGHAVELNQLLVSRPR